MILRILMIALVIISAVVGFVLQKSPYHIDSLGAPVDQHALDHRDSAYSHISWVASDSGNYMQLRFFNKVEGGACLTPSWSDYSALNDAATSAHPENPNSLAHLIPEKPWPAQDAPNSTWPADLAHPNPGTLPHTKYVCLFPSAVLLNKSVMAAAGGDSRAAKPNIIIVGLGSAIGISVLAHHFPEASITVVDIDQVVIDMVMGHYPLINWLTTQSCSDGRPRLKIVARDARQYIHYADMRNDNGMKYDLVILDAYTSGSTIPSHLMTVEFFEEIRQSMNDDGILMSNIIGSYTGKKKHVLGGAMRSMHAAGLTHIHNLPIIRPPVSSGEYFETNDDLTRNNILLASPYPLDPRQRKQAWAQINAFVPYPELRTGTYVSELLMLLDDNRFSTAQVSTENFSKPLLRNLRSQALITHKQLLKGHKTFTKNDDVLTVRLDDQQLIDDCLSDVRARHTDDMPLGWDIRKNKQTALYYQKTDHLLFVRRCFERSVAAAQKRDGKLYRHSMEYVTGIDDDSRPLSLNPDAPLFIDAQPNADIYNR